MLQNMDNNSLRRMPSTKRTPDHNQIQETPNPAHHPHYAFPTYPADQHYPPQYEFDPNAASLDNFYQQYDHHGTPLLQDGSGQYSQSGQVYHQQYDKYNYQTGV